MSYELDDRIKEKIWDLIRGYDEDNSEDEFEEIWEEISDLYANEIQDVRDELDDDKEELEDRVEELEEELEELQKRDFIDFKIKNLYQQELFNFFKENIDKLTLEKLQSII